MKGFNSIMTINRTSAEIWNERLQICMDEYSEGRLTQQALANKLCKNQKTVFKWLHVGQTTGDETYHFPKYETMEEIARFFGVQVGFLTGETDCKSFEMEDAVDFTGLTETSLEKIRLATRLETAFQSVEMMNVEARKIISALIETDGFFGLVMALEELDRAYPSSGSERQVWTDLENKYGAALLNKALDFDPHDEESAAMHDDPRLADAYCETQNAIDNLRDLSISSELIMEAMRYRITMQFSKMVSELCPEQTEPSQN